MEIIAAITNFTDNERGWRIAAGCTSRRAKPCLPSFVCYATKTREIFHRYCSCADKMPVNFEADLPLASFATPEPYEAAKLETNAKSASCKQEV